MDTINDNTSYQRLEENSIPIPTIVPTPISNTGGASQIAIKRERQNASTLSCTIRLCHLILCSVLLIITVANV